MRRPPQVRVILTVAGLLSLLPSSLVSAAQSTPVPASYTSDAYGVAVTWDPESWTIDPASTRSQSGDTELDLLTLTNDSATLRMGIEHRADASASDCVSREAQTLAQAPGVTNVAPIGLDNGSVLEGVEGGIAFIGLERELAADAPAGTAAMTFVECRLLASGASLWFILESTTDDFSRDMAAAGAVNASLVIDGVMVTTPGAVPATATAELATPSAQDTAANAEFGARVEAITAGAPLTQPLNGDLVQSEGAATLAATGADPADFYLRVRFQTPETAAPWDFGVAFRHAGGEEYRLVIDSGGGWYLTRGVDTDVQTGTVGHLVTRPGGVNSLELIAEGDAGWFRVNDEVVGPLDLSAIADGGPIAIGTAFFAENTTAGATLPYRALAVWAPPAPLSNGTAATPVAPVMDELAAGPDSTPDATPSAADQEPLATPVAGTPRPDAP